MSRETTSPELPPQAPEESLENFMSEEHKKIIQTRFDLISAERAIKRLIGEGLIHPKDQLLDIFSAIEKELERIKNVK